MYKQNLDINKEISYEKEPKILELKSTITNLKIYQKGSELDLSKQQKESVNLKTGQLTLTTLENRRGENGEK